MNIKGIAASTFVGFNAGWLSSEIFITHQMPWQLSFPLSLLIAAVAAYCTRYLPVSLGGYREPPIFECPYCGADLAIETHYPECEWPIIRPTANRNPPLA